MASNGHHGRLLIGKKDICDYLKIGEPMFYELIRKIGMPARVINNRWYAHSDNIDDFFRRYTNTRASDAPENAE